MYYITNILTALLNVGKMANENVTLFKTENHLQIEMKHTLRKKYFRAPFLALKVVTKGGLYSVPGRTKYYLEGP